MPPALRISAKNLGALAMPDFCPRCYWIQMRCGNKLPYQIFPGIFSNIDNYTKHIVHGWFDRHGEAPEWLRDLGPIRSYRKPPHHSKFKMTVESASVEIWGSPDAVFVRNDNSFLIADYKTAKFTAYQDHLFPMYEAQLNAYAAIGEQCGLSPVAALALIYTEPVAREHAASRDGQTLADGFRMDFAARILPVAIDPEMIPRLCQKAREVLGSKRPPRRRSSCKNCGLLETLLDVATAKSDL